MEALTCLIEVFCSTKRATVERIAVDQSVITLWDRCEEEEQGRRRAAE